MFDWDKFRTKLEDDIGELLKMDLFFSGATKCYIVLDRDANSCRCKCGGFTSKHFTEMYRNAIGERYIGPGPGFYLNTSHCSEEPTPEELAGLRSVAVHELAHWLDVPVMVRFDSPVAPMVKPRSFDATAQQMDIPFSASLNEQRGMHGENFVRCLVHIASRAEKAGWLLDRDRLFCWNRWGFAGYKWYLGLLQPEIDELKDQPLFTLTVIKSPEFYSQWWYRNRSMLDALHKRSVSREMAFESLEKVAEPTVSVA